MKVVIGDLEFSTKQRSYEFVRDLIYRKGARFIDADDEDFAFFTELVKFKGLTCVAFELFTTPQTGKTLHLRGTLADESTKQISWRDCARCSVTKDTPQNMLNQAMRYAVDGQILAYRQQNVNHQCADCHGYDNVQVDHLLQFCIIKRDFLANETDWPGSFDQNGFGQWVFKTADQEFADRWAAYHQSRATYQFLCQPCHAEKTKVENRRRHAMAYASKQVVKNRRKVKALQLRINKYKAKIAELESIINELQV